MTQGQAAADTVDFYFDLASPYAYFAHGAITALARRHGLQLRRRPVLLWVLLKELGMPTPLEHAAKRSYLEQDMRRSAACLGLPFQLPQRFPASHAAARLYYSLQAQLQQQWPALDAGFVEAVFRACFVDGRDIADSATLVEVAASVGVAVNQAGPALEAETGRLALRQANAEAVQRGVWGSPFWFWGGESFFGADRLPQFELRLKQALSGGQIR